MEDIASNLIMASMDGLNSGGVPQVPRFQARQDGHVERGGKRWVRRQDNSKFVGNRHIVNPSRKDFELSWSHPRTTFPKPLPPFISRHMSAPSTPLPKYDPISTNAGRYSLGLKGIRRELRRSRPTAEQMVRDIEQELTEWLFSAGVILSPDSQQDPLAGGIVGENIGFSNAIREISRTPTELIWRIDDDFPRFLLHCVARFHHVVSFSKTVLSGQSHVRLTHLLRPNLTRPDFTTRNTLNTPPTSDIDSISILADTEESDFDVASRLDPVAEDDSRSEVSHTSEGQRIFSTHRVLSRHPSREREYEASIDETESSLGRDEGESLSMSIISGGDWDSTSKRGVPPPGHLPRREMKSLLNESRLQFWRYVFE